MNWDFKMLTKKKSSAASILSRFGYVCMCTLFSFFVSFYKLDLTLVEISWLYLKTSRNPQPEENMPQTWSLPLKCFPKSQNYVTIQSIILSLACTTYLKKSFYICFVLCFSFQLYLFSKGFKNMNPKGTTYLLVVLIDGLVESGGDPGHECGSLAVDRQCCHAGRLTVVRLHLTLLLHWK